MILLEGKKCYLRILKEEDAGALTELLVRNRFYWTIYEPKHHNSYYTISVQREKIRESLYQMKDKREYSFGIFDSATSMLVGHISLYSIKRLPFQSGFVGYSIDEQQIGKGFGTEAVKLVLKFAFKDLGLHRIEAYVSPKNAGSIRVLEKAGLQREGLLKELLFINGVWEDHYMYAVLDKDF